MLVDFEVDSTGARDGHPLHAEHPELLVGIAFIDQARLPVHHRPHAELARAAGEGGGHLALGAVAHGRGDARRIPVGPLHRERVVRARVEVRLLPLADQRFQVAHERRGVGGRLRLKLQN